MGNVCKTLKFRIKICALWKRSIVGFSKKLCLTQALVELPIHSEKETKASFVGWWKLLLSPSTTNNIKPWFVRFVFASVVWVELTLYLRFIKSHDIQLGWWWRPGWRWAYVISWEQGRRHFKRTCNTLMAQNVINVMLVNEKILMDLDESIIMWIYPSKCSASGPWTAEL